MKKWVFAILATIIAMIICSTLIVLIFGNTTTLTLIIGAGISYHTGRYVYNYFKEKSENAL